MRDFSLPVGARTGHTLVAHPRWGKSSRPIRHPHRTTKPSRRRSNNDLITKRDLIIMIFSLRLDLRGVRIPFRYSATSCELTFDIGNNDNNNNPTGRQDRPKSVVTTAPVVPSPLGRRAEPPSSRLPSAANQHHCSVRFDTRTSPRNRHTSSIGVLSTDWGVYSKKTEDRPVRRQTKQGYSTYY